MFILPIFHYLSIEMKINYKKRNYFHRKKEGFVNSISMKKEKEGRFAKSKQLLYNNRQEVIL